MSALTKFESLVENLLEGSLTYLLRGQLQPVEIAKRLAREMEVSKAISVDRVFVSNEYHVYLSLSDFQRLEPMRATLERELAEYLVGVARERRLTMISKPIVRLETGENLPPRQVRVQAKMVEQPSPAQPTAGAAVSPPGEALPAQLYGQTRRFDSDQVKRALHGPSGGKTVHAALVVGSGPATGARYLIDKQTVTLGRGLGNDVVVDDARVSRHHAELRLVGGKYSIHDLKSTNGTWVNGKQVDECILQDGDMVSLGGQEFSFESEAEV